MKAYTMALSIIPNVIHYAIADYESFEVREVLINGKPKGEYHVKIKDGSSIGGAVQYFIGKLPDCMVGQVDITGTLNLEYPIFIIVQSGLIADSMKDIFESMDEELKNHKLTRHTNKE